jgi:hypothetical protein
VAVDDIRHRRWIVGVDLAREPGAGSLLGLAGSVGEISDSIFAAG